MGGTNTVRQILVGLAVILMIMAGAVSSERYCDDRYVPAKKECCTPREVLYLIGNCCMPNFGVCRCLVGRMSEEKRAECAMDSFMNAPTAAAPTPAPTSGRPIPSETPQPTTTTITSTTTPRPTTPQTTTTTTTPRPTTPQPTTPTRTTTTTTPRPTTVSTTTTPTTTPRPTTTSTTTTATTPKPVVVTMSEPLERLCPVAPPSIMKSRLLFGDPVTDRCAHNGMIALHIDIQGKKNTFCNMVAYFNPFKQGREVVMDSSCWQLLRDLEQQGFKPYATSQGFEFPISVTWALFSSYRTVSSTLTNHTIAVPTVTLAVLLDALVAACDNTACLYNPFLMGAAIDIVNKPCFLLSYGSTGFNSYGEIIDPNGLMRVEVRIVIPELCGLMRDVTDVLCVMITPPASTCLGDTSAGLFCYLNTGEEVLMGVTAFNPVCDGLTVYVPINKKLIPQ